MNHNYNNKETVTSLSEFLSVVKKIGGGGHGKLSLYRGQTDIAWELVPGICRLPLFDKTKSISSLPIARPKEKPGGSPVTAIKGTNTKSIERRMLVVFIDKYATHFPPWVWSGTPAEVGWKQIAIAQHYGLPTRLMDWTSNALAALFFAVEQPATKCKKKYCEHCSNKKRDRFHDACVAVLTGRDSFSISSLAKNNSRPQLYKPSSPRFQIGIIRPPLIDNRIAAQDSYFTITENPAEPIIPNHIIQIPAELREEIKQDLSFFAGINSARMYPDFQGIASHLRWDVKHWDGDTGVAISKSKNVARNTLGQVPLRRRDDTSGNAA
jgi:hypothetical protein